ncbi:regulator of sigma E protease [Marininema mesophilum]|uniref:Zinc metalloprotease n=1 Tax=Marininema mesophilum TaxID=1048340 RepID=A0A1H2U8H7_9BACL|nr:RIP metalloprotease RseP [Marininema mesophilum]SDW52451.1 regulator of sigma E protease [Marininema mesophilum]
MQTIISFILVLSVLVFIHELGHFLFAKRAGILVREFAIGFGPKLISVFRGETLYSIRILPLGGFVRMAGEDPEIVDLKTGSHLILDRDKEGRVVRIRAPKSTAGEESMMEATAREYGDMDGLANSGLPKHLPQVKDTVSGKLLEADLEKDLFVQLEGDDGEDIRYSLHPQAVIQYDEKSITQIAPLDRQFSSKSVLDKALTIIAGPAFNFILTIIVLAGLVYATGINTKVSIQNTVPGSPAAKAGIKAGDIVREVEGKTITSTGDIRIPLQDAGGKPLKMVLERANQKYTTTVKPQKKNDQFLIGIQMKQETRESTLSEAAVEGVKNTWDMTVLLFDGFGKLITGEVGVKNLAGPVGIASITGQAAQAGWVSIIHLTALLSLNLGILNILPFPALDGSRLVFILLEGLRGKPIDPNKESMVHFVGFALLMVLMLFVTYNDILRIFFKS